MIMGVELRFSEEKKTTMDLTFFFFFYENKGKVGGKKNKKKQKAKSKKGRSSFARRLCIRGIQVWLLCLQVFVTWVLGGGVDIFRFWRGSWVED